MLGLLERQVDALVNLKKKVIIFIVEGPSDKAAFGTIFQNYFSTDEVRFLVIHGDITTEPHVSRDNIISRLNDQIKRTMDRYGYESEDVQEVIHLVDTDGAFVKTDIVVQNDSAEKPFYYEDRIETNNRDGIISRNECKKGILTKLYLTGKVCESLCKGGIKYRVYYNSCNLEHVLYGELKAFTDREKEELADDFAEKYEDDVEAFVAFITNPEFAVIDSYKKTWAFIEKDLNSLKRHSNLGLVFDRK